METTLADKRLFYFYLYVRNVLLFSYFLPWQVILLTAIFTTFIEWHISKIFLIIYSLYIFMIYLTALVLLQREKYILFSWKFFFHFSKNFKFKSSFVYFRHKEDNNADVYYHRFENQADTLCIFTSLWIWIKSFKNISLERFKAHVPNDHSTLA